jgi:hypothetical protein
LILCVRKELWCCGSEENENVGRLRQTQRTRLSAEEQDAGLASLGQATTASRVTRTISWIPAPSCFAASMRPDFFLPMVFLEMSSHLFYFEQKYADFKYFTSKCKMNTDFKCLMS